MKSIKIIFKSIIQLMLIAFVGIFATSCEDDGRTDGFSKKGEVELRSLTPEQKEVIAYLPTNVIIAHRGTEFWAPEESEAAMRWARNMGADYLEIDLQRTRDGVVVALHDENLKRTTNISVIYPNRQNNFVSTFTYEELLRLDIGSWFNETNPNQARSSFVGLDVLTLEDVVKIAEGKRIKRDSNGKRIYTKSAEGKYTFEYEDDPFDNGNRPGVYIETKAPYLFAGIEKNLAQELTQLGWYHDDIGKMKKIPYKNGVKGQVDIANTPARVIVQTFDISSLSYLKASFKRLIPMAYLMYDVTNPPNVNTYAEKINMGIENGATIMAPNIDYVTGVPTSLNPWQGDMIRRTGLHIHAWSFNTQEQYIKYTGPWSDPEGKGGADKNYLDGAFTNLSDIALNYYNGYLQPLKDKGRDYFRSNKHVNMPDNIHKDKTIKPAYQILDELGYIK